MTADPVAVDVLHVEIRLKQSRVHGRMEVDVGSRVACPHAVGQPGITEGTRDLVAHFEVIDADRRTDRREQTFRFRAVLFPHRFDRGPGCIGDRASPTGVNGRNRAACGIVQQDRHAVGDPDHEESIRSVRDQNVGSGRWPGTRGAVIDEDLLAVNLVQQQGSIGLGHVELLAQSFEIGFGRNEIRSGATASSRQVEGRLEFRGVSAVTGGEGVVDAVFAQLGRLPHDDAFPEVDPVKRSAIMSSAPPAGVSSSGFHLIESYHVRISCHEFPWALVLPQLPCENPLHVIR